MKAYITEEQFDRWIKNMNHKNKTGTSWIYDEGRRTKLYRSSEDDYINYQEEIMTDLGDYTAAGLYFIKDKKRIYLYVVPCPY
jgi:hypothetical protein